MATRIEKIRRINTIIMTPQHQQQQAWILKPKKGGGEKKNSHQPIKKNRDKPRTVVRMIWITKSSTTTTTTASISGTTTNQCCCVLQETLQRLRMTRLFWRLLKLIRWDLVYSFNQKRLCARARVYMYLFFFVAVGTHFGWKERGISVFTALEPNQILTGCVECILKTPHESLHLLSKFSL